LATVSASAKSQALTTGLQSCHTGFPRIARDRRSCGSVALPSPLKEVPVIYSVGYEQRDIDGFIEVLQRHAVAELIDVRLTPSSRKPGFSKTRLSEALSDAGIAYRHIRDLGNPRENRDGFRAGCSDAVSAYRARLDNGSRGAVEAVVEAANDHAVALFCFERQASRCHRHTITEVAQEMDPRLPVLHIE
jgi:uncharacterized protein (DUF488 family)